LALVQQNARWDGRGEIKKIQEAESFVRNRGSTCGGPSEIEKIAMASAQCSKKKPEFI
jgi:hypothetical protein